MSGSLNDNFYIPISGGGDETGCSAKGAFCLFGLRPTCVAEVNCRQGWCPFSFPCGLPCSVCSHGTAGGKSVRVCVRSLKLSCIHAPPRHGIGKRFGSLSWDRKQQGFHVGLSPSGISSPPSRKSRDAQNSPKVTRCMLTSYSQLLSFEACFCGWFFFFLFFLPFQMLLAISPAEIVFCCICALHSPK